MKNSIEICTRKSNDGQRVFVDRMLVSIDDLTFGSPDATSLSGLMVGAIDCLTLNIEEQKSNTDFVQEILDKKITPEYFFQLLHDACWITGDWPESCSDSLVAPSVYFGLPFGTEIFDADEAYFVVVSSMEGVLLARKKNNNEYVMLKICVNDYVSIWERAKAEIISSAI